MDAELSRKAAIAMQSPYWRWMKLGFVNEEQADFDASLIAKLVEAKTFDNLDDGDKKLLERCENSLEVAKNLAISPSTFDSAQLEKIMQALGVM